MLPEMLDAHQQPEEPPAVVTLPLRGSVLCLDCERLYTIRPTGCPACGGSAFFPITRVIQPMEAKT